jgi:hypothetical protein
MSRVGKPLPDLTDDELRSELRQSAEHVSYAYNDLMAEIDRRAARRQATASFFLGVVSIVIAVVAVLVAVFR